jgi:type IV pilus assembly protein PilA
MTKEKTMPRYRQPKQSGFTLIELLIVVAIIGILSAVAVPAYQNHIKTSEASVAVSTAGALLTNIDLYIQNHDKFPSETNFKDIGASANMTPLGTIALIPDTNAEQFGAITFTFSKASQLQDKVVTFSKTEDNGWQCSQNTEVTLKSCKAG